MKLRLDSDYVWARKIAKCFIDNNVCVGVSDHEAVLIGVDLHNLFVVHDGSSHNVYRFVTIDLETAKFDPFAAMREGVCTDIGKLESYDGGFHSYNIYSKNPNICTEWCRTLSGVEVME